MKVLDSLLLAYEDRSDDFKKMITRAYKYVSTNRYSIIANKIKNSYYVTITLYNGLSITVKRKDPEEAKWICWYKAVETLAIAEHWFTYKYKIRLNNYYTLPYMHNGKPIDYGKKIHFTKAKFINLYINKRPSLFY